MVAKKIKKKIKTMAIIYKVIEMKNCLRSVVCASKVNMPKLDKGNIRKEDVGI